MIRMIRMRIKIATVIFVACVSLLSCSPLFAQEGDQGTYVDPESVNSVTNTTDSEYRAAVESIPYDNGSQLENVEDLERYPSEERLQNQSYEQTQMDGSESYEGSYNYSDAQGEYGSESEYHYE